MAHRGRPRHHLIHLLQELALSPDLVRVIANEMHGNGRTLEGALKRLKLDSTQWNHRSHILRALGLLDPYFADNPSWDLRLHIRRVIDEMNPSEIGLDPLDVSLYVMLRLASLSEVATAQFFQIEPGEAYRRSQVIEGRVHAGELNPAIFDFVSEQVVQKICDETP